MSNKKLKTIANQLNMLTFNDYYYRLMLLARSVFKWNNLPNNIDEKWIEKYLFGHGKCVFFNDKDRGFMIARITQSGELNCYEEPTRVTPYGVNYTGESLDTMTECVLIRNNDEMIPTSQTIQLYAYRLAELTRAIDTNVNAQKTPVVILCDEKQKLTMKALFEQYTGNEPAIFGDKNLVNNEVKALKTDAPIVFDKLQIHKHDIWNECMTFLGINNANMDKRERLVDDEVQANNEQVQMGALVMLKSRQMACERINALFGTNISVEFRMPRIGSQEVTEGDIKEVV